MISIIPERNMSFGTKFHGDPSNSCREISSCNTTAGNLMMVLDEKLGVFQK